MIIHDQQTLKDIIKVTLSILRENFFYEEEVLTRFLKVYMDSFQTEVLHFLTNAEKDILDELQTSQLARIHFTSYMASVNLHFVFKKDLHFTDQELLAFESILPKYIGASKHETESRHKRKNY